jgi:hypothetical protein
MTQPIELLVEEPLPRVLRMAPDPADTYEAALAAGQAALHSEIRRQGGAKAVS